MLKKILLLIFLVLVIIAGVYYKTIVRLYHGYNMLEASKERAKYYVLDQNASLQDITQKLIEDKSIPDDLKTPLINGERKIVIFKYLSEGNYVAGYMSYLVQGEHPVMIFLRGGNGFFGIMRPNNKFSFLKDYNVIGTLYRGNIYGGKDEFGGNDIQDVENLIKFFPELELFTQKTLHPPFDIMGVSRGAMEMFISLAKSEYVKPKIAHAISVSGNVDLHLSMEQRPEMKYLFMTEYKESTEKSFDAWLNQRDPIYNAKDLPKMLKVLLAYGLADDRVSLEEQQNFKKMLDKEKIEAELVTIPDANHGFENHFDELQKVITDFVSKKT